MSKIGLIISREYRTRVLKKSFILLTFLAPILMVALMAVPIWLASLDGDDEKHIVVIDHSGLYQDAFSDKKNYTFEFTNQSFESAKEQQQSSKLTGILVISGKLTDEQSTVTFYSDKQAQMEMVNYIEQQLNTFVTDQKIAEQDIPGLKQIMAKTRTNLEVSTVKWTEDGEEKEGSVELAVVVGMITALIIYMFIIIYGAQVMSGVVQEKTNRIVEVIISSVKPFELMMGKIIGIALVGLTQVALWTVLTIIFSSAIGSLDLFTPELTNDIVQNTEQLASAQGPDMATVGSELFSTLSGFNFGKLLLMFVLYFLGGYLLYASLFAAIGSVVDNETDTNQFSLILTLPIIFAIYAAIYSAENPDAPLAFWCSMIPFTSPIVMMVRIPFDVATWEIVLSFIILIASFIGSTWLAGRIYRTGILMYGKKATLRELWKWIKY